MNLLDCKIFIFAYNNTGVRILFNIHKQIISTINLPKKNSYFSIRIYNHFKRKNKRYT